MSKYANKAFWTDTFDRAVSTVAQAAVAVLTANVTGLLDVDWVQIASVSGLAGAVSVLTSVAFRGRDESPTPSRDDVLASLANLTPQERENDINAAAARKNI